MKRNLLATSALWLFLFMLTLNGAFGSNADSNPPLLPFLQDGLWGFIDASGKIVIQPQFQLIYDPEPFTGELSMVMNKADLKWGFIDRTGTYRIKPQYNACTQFSEGLAAAKLQFNQKTRSENAPKNLQANWGRVGFIDQAGEKAITFGYDFARPFSDGLAIVVIEGKHNKTGLLVDGKWGAIDRNGKFVIQPKFDYMSDFNCGTAIVNIGGKRSDFMGIKGGKWGLIDKKGRLIAPPQFERIGTDFTDGLLNVQVDHKWGFINQTGKMVIEPQFDDVEGYSDGLAAVNLGGIWQNESSFSQGGKWGFINTQGQMVIPAIFDKAFRFEHGYAKVLWRPKENQPPKWGLIAKNGKFVVQPRYEDLIYYDPDHITFMIKSGENYKWGLMDLDGAIRIIPVYDDLNISLEYKLAAFYVKTATNGTPPGKWGFMTLTGKIVAQPQYDYYVWLKGGFIKVCSGNKIGYLNCTGATIWKPTK